MKPSGKADEDKADAAAIEKVEALSESNAADSAHLRTVAEIEHNEAMKIQHAAKREEDDAERLLKDADRIGSEVDKNPAAEKTDAAHLEEMAQKEKDTVKKAVDKAAAAAIEKVE